MLRVLSNRTYRHLLAAQVVALLGTGLATVALGLLAFELAGGDAGAVLGTALAIKMVAYVGVAPVASAFTALLPRRATLVVLDLVRALVAALLPFITEIWHVYVLIFVLQSASAAFTPAFQATIPDILPDEKDYTQALSLSRLAYDLESLVSPALAAVLLTVIAHHHLFVATSLGFLASAVLVLSVLLPRIVQVTRRGTYDRTTRGLRIYLSTPRLRGLLALNAATAAAGSMVIVNTVVLVQAQFGLDQRATAIALTAFGGGSMAAALALPRLLATIAERAVMVSGAAALCVATLLGAFVADLGPLLALWAVIGLAYSTVQTPSGRLLRRSAQPEDRPAVFAAQFALSHACWLVTYPLAGWVGARAGTPIAFLVLGGIAVAGTIAALRLWPAGDAEEVEHFHSNLVAGDPHLAGAETSKGGFRHRHAFVIDDRHAEWPRSV